MKRFLKSWALAAIVVAALASVLAPRAGAQASASGTIIDPTGKPWADIVIQSVSDQGAKQETKTDKEGKFAFYNLRPGIYSFFVVFPPPNDKQPPYEVKRQVQSGTETKIDVNFQEVIAKQGGAAQEQMKKNEEAKSKLEGLKAHFNAGNALIEQEKQAKADLQKAPADQRDAAKQKLANLGDQAVKEFQEAAKNLGEKDPNSHLVWVKLGDAYDIAGRNDEAVQAYQQAISAKPEMGDYYNRLGNVLARSGKIEEAKAAYTKSAELDPANAATAWRNFGISLYNAQHMTEGIEPLKKSTELDPKNAQAWYLLASCMMASPDIYKKVGDKLVVTPLPGTVEAYQKAIDLDSNGTWGNQAKQGLEQLNQMTGGIETKVNMKKKKP